jgi:hypothetical protein
VEQLFNGIPGVVMQLRKLSTRALTASMLCAVTWAQTEVGPSIRTDSVAGFKAANETSIAVSEANPLVVVGSWNDYRDGNVRLGVGLSTDGGATWSDSVIRPDMAFQAPLEGDPMTAFCNRTGTLWVGGLSFGGNGGIFVARKDPGDAAFQAPVMARISGSVDKGWMAAGAAPGMPDQTQLYVAYNEGLITSSDMGATWSAPASLGTGLGFLPKVGPAGELYIGYWDTSGASDTHRIIRSFDGGATLLPPVLVAQRMDVWGADGSRFPGDFRVVPLQGLAVDPNTGDVYFVYPDTTDVAAGNSNVDIYFTRSVDQGATWSVPVVINDDASRPADQFFPWIEVDRTGRLHMLFFNTRHNQQDDAAFQGLVDAYYSYSDDGGGSWMETRLTGSSFSSINDGFGGGFLGDYLGLATAGGRALPFYCASSAATSTDVFVHSITDGPATTYCMGLACPCGNDDPAAGCGNKGFDDSVATGGTLTASGSNGLAANDIVIVVGGVRAGASGLIFAGPNRIAPPFGDGLRCVGGATFRYPVRASNGAGQITYGPNFVTSVPRASVMTVGSTWNYQGWFRDNAGPCGSGFNTSNAISVTWH